MQAKRTEIPVIRADGSPATVIRITPYRIGNDLSGKKSTTEMLSELFINGERVNKTSDGFQVVNTGEILTPVER
jgi:hypothetical protein